MKDIIRNFFIPKIKMYTHRTRFQHKSQGKALSDTKNIVTALVYFCNYPYGTPCTMIQSWLNWIPIAADSMHITFSVMLRSWWEISGLDLVLLRLLPWNHLGVCEHLLNFAWRRRRCEARLSLLCVCIMMMASTVYIASGKSRTWNMFTNAAASSFNVYVNFVFVPTSLSMYSY